MFILAEAAPTYFAYTGISDVGDVFAVGYSCSIFGAIVYSEFCF